MNDRIKALMYELQVQQVRLAAEAAKVSLSYTGQTVPEELREIYLIGVKMTHIATTIEDITKVKL